METQLVKLDAPYKVICNPSGEFGVHIATLIVIKEELSNKDKIAVVHSYPVVDDKYKVGGSVWMAWEVDECKAVCSQGDLFLTLQDVARVMQYYYEKGNVLLKNIPMRLRLALISNDVRIKPPLDKNQKEIRDFITELEFEEKGDSVLVLSKTDSPFFFVGNYAARVHPPAQFYHVGLSIERAINEICELRDHYISAFRGVTSIKFISKQRNYQEFIDKLNSAHSMYAQ